MLDFFKKLFAPERSSDTAKERLRLVLLSDHLSLAPDTIVALKRDLLEVISRYVDIDAGNADVTFEHREHEVAMLASIPITGVRERTVEVAPPLAAAPEQHDVPTSDATGVSGANPASDGASQDAISKENEPGGASVATLPVRSGNAARPRRRRRKKHGVAAVEVRRATLQNGDAQLDTDTT